MPAEVITIGARARRAELLSRITGKPWEPGRARKLGIRPRMTKQPVDVYGMEEAATPAGPVTRPTREAGEYNRRQLDTARTLELFLATRKTP